MRSASSPVSITSASGRAGSIADRVTHWFAAFAKALRNRAELRQLSQFDEHMLRDLGLTRSDVLAAVEAPLSQDPTERLARTVRERRVARAAQKREAAGGWN